MPAIQRYLQEIGAALRAGTATEHTHRPALKTLLEAMAPGVVATNEPKRVACGAPDFVVTRGRTPLGYVEAKDVDTALARAERTPQLRRYLESLGNLVLTDYLEFRWYVGGEHRLTARLATAGADGRLRATPGGADAVRALLAAFLAAEAPTVGRARELAERMAAIARLIRDSIARALAEEDEDDPLHAQMEGFRAVLLHDLTAEQFADMYAQTIAYGLFAARLNTPANGERFTREHAAYELPRTNPFLRRMFGHIAGPSLDARIEWAVDDLAELLHRADMAEVLRDFGRRTRQEDPVVHFYETFLAAYDPRMREARGVYYTPEPVVDYIVRSVDHLLRRDFGLNAGLADTGKLRIGYPDAKKETAEVHRVQILDPATGTGTFLHAVVDQIHERLREQGQAGAWSGYVRDHLLPRVWGFELLMAPYAVAHLKLGLQLKELGYDFATDERLGIYLTNTLDEAHEDAALPLFARWIAEEANAASRVKTTLPILVVLGNPPYSNFGQLNRQPWVRALLDDYKQGLGERKLNLDDDFIKFIRWAEWRIERTGQGVLAFVTNHSYLDGITHRRMREHLMRTFDALYLLDLHGNSRKGEVAPDGAPDENVFDIQQGVSIILAVKTPTTAATDGEAPLARVFHAELWGTREAKYRALAGSEVSTTEWTELEPHAPYYFFVPKDFDAREEYEEGWKITEILTTHQNGLKTDRDDLFFDFDRDELDRRMRTFYSPAGLESPFAERYRVERSSSYDLVTRRASTAFGSENIHRCLYRPFDVRWLYYAPGLTSRPAWEVMQHIRGRLNVSLITTRQTSDLWGVLASDALAGHKSVAAYDINTIFPLYLYPTPDSAPAGLFAAAAAEDAAAGGRTPNLAPEFVVAFAERLGLDFVPDGRGDGERSFGPEDVFHYLYAVLHSPAYRERYAEFLKIDFPRVPLTGDAALFRRLCAHGAELTALHLLRAERPLVTRFPVAGDNIVERVRYAAPDEAESGEGGRVWINPTQYFSGVAPEVWAFRVGGYQVAEKWLKDRRGRRLSYDELTHYQRTLAALARTMDVMAAIDESIDAHGGWPLA